MRIAALATVLAAFLAGASGAGAHGDPGSATLRNGLVFLDAGTTPRAQQAELVAAVTSANARGFPVRVAVISSAGDLGRQAAYWGRPRSYAAYLVRELRSEAGYRGRLLVVMPGGLAFAWPGHGPAASSPLEGVRVGRTPAELAEAAVQAVRLLAKQDGVELSASGGPAGHANRDRLKIVVGVLALILLGAAARSVSRRRVR